MSLSTGAVVATALGTLGVFALIAMVPKQHQPRPGEHGFTYRGKPFVAFPENGHWVLDIGDEMHVHDSNMQPFMSASAAARFGRKRIDSDDPPRFQNPSSNRLIEAAVKSAQLYRGSMGLPIKTQQRFYARMMTAARKVAAAYGMDETTALEQISTQASSRGNVTPQPGKDY